MNTSKIKLDRADIGDSQILRHKTDFSSLKNTINLNTEVTNFIQKSIFKSAKLWSIVVPSIVAITAGIYFTTKSINNSGTTNSNTTIISDTVKTSENTVTSAITPPFIKHDIPYQEFEIEPGENVKLTSERGTEIHIPSHAFTYKSGESPTGKVTIQFREFHNPLEFFLSGIPMEYDSAGTKYTFESAGMIDIKGNCNGKEVIVKQGKNIDINLASDNDDPKFNLYNLDKNTGFWSCLGKDKIIKNNISDNFTDKEKKISESNLSETNLSEFDINSSYMSEIIEPIIPQKADPQKYVFNLDNDKDKFPELAMYEEVLFEVDEDKCYFEEVYYTIIWESLDLKESDIKGYYDLCLSRKDTSVNLVF